MNKLLIYLDDLLVLNIKKTHSHSQLFILVDVDAKQRLQTHAQINKHPNHYLPGRESNSRGRAVNNICPSTSHLVIPMY